LQPDEFDQLLLGSVNDLLHWLLKYLKARNDKNQYNNQFTSVPQYPGLQHFSKPFDLVQSGTLQGKEICGMIRTLAVNSTPVFDCSKVDRKTVVDNTSDGIVMEAVPALCIFSVLVCH